MEIVLSNGTVIEVLLINIAQNYIDWKYTDQSQHCRTVVELTDYASALQEMKDALELEIVSV